MNHPRFAAWLCSAAALVLLAVPAFAQQPDALPPEDAPAAQVQTAPAGFQVHRSRHRHGRGRKL